MGHLRESRVWFVTGGKDYDLPIESNLLLDDLTQTAIERRPINGPPYCYRVRPYELRPFGLSLRTGLELEKKGD